MWVNSAVWQGINQSLRVFTILRFYFLLNYERENMQQVTLLAYKFSILGIKDEIHTEVRVFEKDYWFEDQGAKSIPSRNK